MLKKILLTLLLLGFLGSIAAAGMAWWAYDYVTRDLPNLKTIEDYRPPIVSFVYASDGTLLAEFFKERRYPVKIADVPLIVKQAFLASEDAHFYTHPGIDFLGILRAFIKNMRAGSVKQGGSTITQQVVKNLLLTDEKKLKRKVREAVLSYRLEKRLSKDEILEMYLNQIFFGNTAYGVKAAARVYFHKELAEVTIGEAALLAGLPKAPSRYSPLLNAARARKRQKYVIGQMRKNRFISEEQADEALKEKLKYYPADFNNFIHAPYYVAEVRRQLLETWKGPDIDTEGLSIYTPLDLKAEEFATASLQRGLREVDKRRGWRGPIASVSPASDHKAFFEKFKDRIVEEVQPDVIYPALVTEVGRGNGLVKVVLNQSGGDTIALREASWAKKLRNREDHVSFGSPDEKLRPGDVIEVSLAKKEEPAPGKKVQAPTSRFVLDQTPDIEGSLVLLNPNTGEVVNVQGGYSYRRSVFNRATQGLRQPGSAFKPAIYLAAVDGFNYTPSTIVHDQPRTFKVGDEFWTPGNFDDKFLGDITLHTALEKSRNLVSADIVSRIGIDPVIKYARALGITSPLGRNLSLSLGSSEVTLLELTRAYGVLAARGVHFDSSFVNKIVSREGKTLFESESDRLSHARQAINENSAFVIVHMMKSVIQNGTGTRVKPLGRPVAGKTGTSNEDMDTWFVGYTPQWACGIWVGFDTKKTIGDKETGGRVAAPIFLYMMDSFLKYRDSKDYERMVEEAKAEAQRLGVDYVAPEPLPPLDFAVPEGVNPVWVDRATGRLASQGAEGAILEYFVKGSEPSTSAEEEDVGSYLESPEL